MHLSIQALLGYYSKDHLLPPPHTNRDILNKSAYILWGILCKKKKDLE